MASKRSYTLPVLLVILMGMVILAVMLYSKLLIMQQMEKTDEGKKLTERYQYATMFAQRLQEGADLLLKDASMADRMRSKAMLGQAVGVQGETIAFLNEASHRSTGQSYEEAFKPLSQAMTKIMSEQSGNVYNVAEHEGPLTQKEMDMLKIVRDGAAKMKEELLRFHPPVGDAGYRNVAAGEGWIDPALAAGKTLIDTASKLK